MVVDLELRVEWLEDGNVEDLDSLEDLDSTADLYSVADFDSRRRPRTCERGPGGGGGGLVLCG